jgi:hypothetical protein
MPGRPGRRRLSGGWRDGRLSGGWRDGRLSGGWRDGRLLGKTRVNDWAPHCPAPGS